MKERERERERERCTVISVNKLQLNTCLVIRLAFGSFIGEIPIV